MDDKAGIETDGTRFIDASDNDVILQFSQRTKRTTNYNKWLLISELQYNNHVEYQAFIDRLEIINADATDYTDCAHYDDFYNAKNFSKTDIELVSATTSDITDALSTLTSIYTTVQIEYAELQKAAYLTTLAGKITEAEALTAFPMNSSTLATLQSKITAAEAMDEDNSGSEIVTATTELDNAVSAANASKKIYSTFNTLVGTIALQVATFDASGRSAYNNSSAIANYNDRSMTTGVTETAALYAALRVAAKAQTEANSDMTLAIENPSFELGDLTGWSDGAGMLHKVVEADDTSNSIGDVSSSDELDGDYVYACYNGSQANMYVSQTLDDMQPGQYELKLRIAGNTNSDNKYKIKTTFGDDSQTFKLNSTTDLQVITHNISIDEESDLLIKVEYNTPGETMDKPWFKVDNFTLTYVSSALDVESEGANSASNWKWCDGSESASDGNGWTNKQSVSGGYAGVDMVECYNSSNEVVGDVMYCELTDLTPGYYQAEVGFNVHCADYECHAYNGNDNYADKSGSTSIARLYANDAYVTAPLVNSRTASESCNEETIKNILVGDDGKLKFKLKTMENGANWLTVAINSLTYVGTSVSVTPNSEGWATFCSKYNALVPDGVAIYTAQYNAANSTIDVTRNDGVEVIHSGEGVVIKAEAGTYTFIPTLDDADGLEENDLHGTVLSTARNTATGVTTYVLSNKGGDASTAFFPFVGTNIPANKAYLTISGDAALVPIRIMDEVDNTTSIEDIVIDDAPAKLDVNAPMYNVLGMPVNASYKGIVIQNGHKFYIY